MFTFAVADRFARRDYPEDLFAHIDCGGVLAGIVLVHRRWVEPSPHGAVLPQPPRERSRVNAGQARNALGREPFVQRAARRVVAVRFDAILDHEALYLNAP